MSIPPTHQNLKNNYQRLENDRKEALRLLDVFKEELKQIQQSKHNYMSEELEEVMLGLADLVKNTTQTLDNWIKEFDVEILRVKDAIDSLASDDIDEVKTAFRAFILEDTSLSVKNVSMMFYDLNDILNSIQQLDKET